MINFLYINISNWVFHISPPGSLYITHFPPDYVGYALASKKGGPWPG